MLPNPDLAAEISREWSVLLLATVPVPTVRGYEVRIMIIFRIYCTLVLAREAVVKIIMMRTSYGTGNENYYLVAPDSP
jgi:hypothetical protein